MKKLLVATFLFWLPALLLAAAPYEEEMHYFSIFPSQMGAEGDRVQVAAFFWYGCSYCYSFEPKLKKWLKDSPDYVDFVHVPLMNSRPNVALHAKTFYALKLMGIEEQLSPKIYQAIHSKKMKLSTQEEMEAFLATHDVEVEAFRNALNSFAVQTSVRRAGVLRQRFDVRGVPSVVVDGKYRASAIIDLVDYLIDKVRQEKSN